MLPEQQAVRPLRPPHARLAAAAQGQQVPLFSYLQLIFLFEIIRRSNFIKLLKDIVEHLPIYISTAYLPNETIIIQSYLRIMSFA